MNVHTKFRPYKYKTAIFSLLIKKTAPEGKIQQELKGV